MKRKKKIKKYIAYAKNRYLLTLLAFTVWICFFDKNDFLSQKELRDEVRKLETERNWLANEVEKNKADMKALQTNPLTLEKFAREKYMMKKDNEDVFVIVE